MNNAALEISLLTPDFIPKDGKVLFTEQTLAPPGIEYVKGSGTITFNIIGQFSIKWWIATETTLKGPIEFALEAAPGSITPGHSPIKTGQVSGFGVIDVEAPNTTLALKNMSATNVMLSRKTHMTAYLLVTPIVSHPFRVYRGNLGVAGSFIQVPLGNGLYYRLENVTPTRVRLVLAPMFGSTLYDYKRFSIYESTTPEGDFSDSTTLNAATTKDSLILTSSREMHWVLIRVQNPGTKLWSLYEVRFFISGGYTRATVWVNVIEEEVSYS